MTSEELIEAFRLWATKASVGRPNDVAYVLVAVHATPSGVLGSVGAVFRDSLPPEAALLAAVQAITITRNKILSGALPSINSDPAGRPN